MKKIFTTAILTVMIFLLNVGTVKAAEEVPVCDFGVYTITKKLEETGLNIKFSFSTDAPSKDGLYDYFYLFNNVTINFAVNGAGYVNSIQIEAFDVDIDDYRKVILHTCKVLGMTDEMAEYLFYYRRGVPPSGADPGVEINNRAVFLNEVDVDSDIMDFDSMFYALPLP